MADGADRRAEFKRGWGIILASTVGIGLGLAPLGTTYTLGPLSTGLSEEFGWSRAAIMGATIAATCGLLPASFAVGWAADRIGVRRLVVLSQIGLSLCFLALGLLVDSLVRFYICYFVMGMVAAGSLPISFTKSITSWFNRGRGLALGLALAGTGLCGFVVPAFTAGLVETHGWRVAYLALAALPVGIATPLVLGLLREPRPEAAAHPDSSSTSANALAEAARTWRFWLLALIFFPVSFGVTGIITNLVPLLMDRGRDAVSAGELAGLVGISVIAGRVLVGSLVDRFWAPAVGFAFVAAPALACLALATGSGTGAVVVGAIVIVGLATGAEIDLNAYLVSRYFPVGSYGRVYAAQYVILIMGAGIASPVFGLVYDATGSYALILTALAPVFVLAAIGLLKLGPYPSGGASAD
jgi:MFS family permease